MRVENVAHDDQVQRDPLEHGDLVEPQHPDDQRARVFDHVIVHPRENFQQQPLLGPADRLDHKAGIRVPVEEAGAPPLGEILAQALVDADRKVDAAAILLVG